MSDYYTNSKYWQEQECPVCGLDFDISPIPLPKTIIHCSGCNKEWESGEFEPNTYILDNDGNLMVVDYPEK